jgi:hypothetical protein
MALKSRHIKLTWGAGLCVAPEDWTQRHPQPFFMDQGWPKTIRDGLRICWVSGTRRPSDAVRGQLWDTR